LNNQESFDAFLNKILQRPLPTHPMARVRTFAKELVEGAAEGVWATEIRLFRGEIIGGITEENVQTYLSKRWDGKQPHLWLLVTNGYLVERENYLVMTKAAFDLLDEVEAATIFISYKRSASSAFALLVLARLKAEGLEPFLDMSLVPGEDWQAGLKERIEKYDHFIVLLGKDTLSSPEVIKEIVWALEAGLAIIPIWHGGFKYAPDKWNLPQQVDASLRETHTIRVLEESALGYNNAIVELLNRFGITP
jgi:hypothetical protein